MGEKEHPRPSKEELKVLTEALIEAQSTMTLATAKGDVAWSAPVYYVYVKSCFYFFSDPTSRHIEESLGSHHVASSIYANASTWQEIRGIQMSGQIEAVPVRFGAVQVIRAYLKKFPFTKDFFKPGEAMDLDAFAKRFKVRLYRFKPTLVYYLDNSIRFGFREEVKL